MECKRVPWPDALTEEKYCVQDCGWPSKDHAYECKINLLTGRTHQVIQLTLSFFASHNSLLFYFFFIYIS